MFLRALNMVFSHLPSLISLTNQEGGFCQGGELQSNNHFHIRNNLTIIVLLISQ